MDIEKWIEREFTGHGMAMRRRDEPPIPGEPLMSMAIAKELVRRAVAEVQSDMRIDQLCRDQDRASAATFRAAE